MRLTLAIVLASLAIGPLIASPAAAQSTSWNAIVSGEAAITDNVFAAPLGGNRTPDMFFQLRPGFLFARNAPRMIHELTAEAEIVYYLLNSNVPSISGRGGWRGFFRTGPRSEVITSLGAGSGIVTSAASRLTADETMINVLPVGAVTFLQADANQFLSYVATREIRLSQTLFARWNKSDDNADENIVPEGQDPLMATTVESAEAGAAFGIDRSFRRQAVSLEVGASVQRLERIAPPGAAMGSRLDRQVNPRARAQWRYDIDRRLSTSVDGGLVYVVPFGKDPYNPDENRKPGLFPIVGAQFSLTEVWGRATATVRRDVTPNLFLAQNTVNDTASVAVAMPLPWLDDSRRRSPKLVGVGSFGIQRTQLVESETSETASSIGAARIDAAVIYTPRSGVSYGLRYELQYQTGDDRAVMAVQGFFRNTIYATFSVRYPDRVAGAVPKRRAGNATRADRKDLGAVGAEPVVPDLTEGDDEGGDER
ncbi:MAG: hypothetical protein H0T89_36980 [Deltaproteobacteria bacterium]|nr:hypothetical protein [Deltaproteobacteria bacterium]